MAVYLFAWQDFAGVTVVAYHSAVQLQPVQALRDFSDREVRRVVCTQEPKA